MHVCPRHEHPRGKRGLAFLGVFPATNDNMFDLGPCLVNLKCTTKKKPSSGHPTISSTSGKHKIDIAILFAKHVVLQSRIGANQIFKDNRIANRNA